MSGRDVAEDWLDAMTQAFVADVLAELAAARDRWPGTKARLAKIAEEAGEVAGAALKRDEGRKTDQDVYREAVQLAAMVIRFATEGDQEFGYRPSAGRTLIFPDTPAADPAGTDDPAGPAALSLTVTPGHALQPATLAAMRTAAELAAAISAAMVRGAETPRPGPYDMALAALDGRAGFDARDLTIEELETTRDQLLRYAEELQDDYAEDLQEDDHHAREAVDRAQLTADRITALLSAARAKTDTGEATP